ncbi:CG0192-related protein [Nocardioides sp.]|uniref:CG0192-related protein n=1 Tax=Nocardioides sp. TaxID=35761 RepID=UPI002ED904C5
MALLHHATLTPTKKELLDAWLPSQDWAAGLPELTVVGGYRFDDPDGEVGIEGIVLSRADGGFVHVPLTYRAAPLEGAQAHLVGQMEHSALGTRWVYDAEGDPVWRAAVTATVLTGGSGAEEYFEVDGVREVREPLVTVSGSGGVVPDPVAVPVHLVGSDARGEATLTGRWAGGEGVLVVVRSAGSR